MDQEKKQKPAEAVPVPVERQIINQVSDNIIASFQQQLEEDPTAAEKVRKAHGEFAQVGMYRVLAMESAKTLGELAELAEPYARDPGQEGRFELLYNTLIDWQQKATFASSTSLNSVAKDAFHRSLTDFQRVYTQAADGSPKTVIDGIYTNDPEALIEYLKGGALSEEYLREFQAALSPEDLDRIFTLLKDNTKMIVFPTCHLKKVSAMFPGVNLYEAWLVGLPMLMDRIFSTVVSRVGQMKEKEVD